VGGTSNKILSKIQKCMLLCVLCTLQSNKEEGGGALAYLVASGTRSPFRQSQKLPFSVQGANNLWFSPRVMRDSDGAETPSSSEEALCMNRDQESPPQNIKSSMLAGRLCLVWPSGLSLS